MGEVGTELESQLEEHEAGVADLIAAYEAAEAPYFRCRDCHHTCCSAVRCLKLVRVGTERQPG